MKPSLLPVYANEVFTGVEYQVASHLIASGNVKERMEIVLTTRSRYDGRVRNPFDEVEEGHWYARAMSSYSLLQALSGARYDAVDRILYFQPRIKGDFIAFFATETGYGHVGVRNGKPVVQVVKGTIPFERIVYA